jgi:hypothetical protein
MDTDNNISDEVLFQSHIKQINSSILSCSRAITVLKREAESNIEEKLYLMPVIEMLEQHIDFKRHLIEEGKKWLAVELKKKESE